MPEIRLYSKKQKIPKEIEKIQLSNFPELDPKNIGPLLLYKGWRSNNLHNAWEYSKVYKEHIDNNGQVTQKYWDWATKGWSSNTPAKTSKKKCVYHFWDGAKYGTIEARKHIFVSRYIRLVSESDDLKNLRNIVNDCDGIVGLIGSKGLDSKSSLTEILFNQDKYFGYEFVLAMILGRDSSLMDIP